MNISYTIPAAAQIGHVHLKVSDLQRSLDFYCGLQGFEPEICISPSYSELKLLQNQSLRFS